MEDLDKLITEQHDVANLLLLEGKELVNVLDPKDLLLASLCHTLVINNLILHKILTSLDDIKDSLDATYREAVKRGLI